jgi:hypothetical protein
VLPLFRPQTQRAVSVHSAALGAALALALAGCGGGSGESSDATTAQSTAATQTVYANSLCGSLLTWKNRLTSVATTFQGANLTKERLKRAATIVSHANTRLAGDLDALGTPQNIGGPKAEAAVRRLSSELNVSADEIAKAAKKIATKQDALAAVSAVSSTLIKLSTDISTTITQFQGLDVAEGWRRAFANSATCRSLSKS